MNGRAEHLILRSLQGTATEAEERELLTWRAASAANEADYQRRLGVWSLSELGAAFTVAGPPPDAAAIVRLAGQAAAREAERGRTPKRAPWRRAAARLSAAAALVAVGVLLAELRPRPVPEPGFGAEEFVTGEAETATVGLRDGTVVRLAPRSRLRVVDAGSARAVALTGRAYFAVAKREERPFLIHTPAGTMTVLGTRFDLAAEDDDLRLMVIEGRVELSARGARTEVGAGEMARVVKGTPLPTVKVAAADTALEWMGDFLAFQSTPLATAAREIERRYGVRIEIVDAELAQRTVTGWFSGWTLDDLLTVVCTVVEAECSTHRDPITMEAL